MFRKVHMKNIIGVLALAAVCLSCTTMSKEECQSANWRYLGERDSRRGDTSDGYGRLMKSCGEYGIQPNRAEYDAGFAVGLQSYCTYDSGRAFGEQGGYYRGI